MNNKKIYLTQEGLDELQKEFDDLKKHRRPEVLERVSVARDQGDLSENGEYQAARDELSFIDGRIDELEELLKEAVVIAGSKTHKDKIIDLGSNVQLKIDGTDENYRVVGEWEADPTEKKISHQSPLGKALLGHRVGDQIEVDAPAGKVVYTIISIS